MTTTEHFPPPPPQSDWRAPQQQIVYVKAAGNGMAIAGFVLGLIGAVTGMIPLFFMGAFLFGTLGMVFSILGARKAKRHPEVGRRKMAVAGIVLSLAAFGLGIAGAMIVDQAVTEFGEDMEQIGEDFERDMNEIGSQFESYSECIDAIEEVDTGDPSADLDRGLREMERCNSLID